jgi:glycosyltransferase involved in cell wall biosynthesis
MRIALLSSDPDIVYGDGHACPVRLRGLAHALARAGHDVTVILSGLEPGCADPAPALALRALRMPVSVREIDWHFSRIRPDLVIERHFPGSVEGATAAAEAGVPHLYDFESVPALGLGTSLSVRGALPEALSLSRGALVADERAAERLRALMGMDFAVSVVASAVDEAFLGTPPHDQVGRIERQLRLSPNRTRVGCYGALLPEGGLVPLVRALGRIPLERRPRLVVIGDGPERNPGLAAAEEAQVGLVLCGRVPQRDASAYLALCDVVVVPGEDDDGVPRSLVEAMAARRAVIAQPTDAIRQVARHGHDAHLMPFDAPDPLAGALESLLADGPRRERLGAQARRTAATRHTWDARTETVLRLADRVRLSVSHAEDAWQPASRSAGVEN